MHSTTIHPTSIAISLSIQSETPWLVETAQWLASPIGKLFPGSKFDNPSYGMAQVGVDGYDLLKENSQAYIDYEKVSRFPYFALNTPEVSTAAMIEKIAPIIETCQKRECTPTDQEIAIALSQNGKGFTLKDLEYLLGDERRQSNDGITIIDWQEEFIHRGTKDDFYIDWRASNHNFDTWFMLKRYYNNALAMQAEGWELPPDVDWDYIDELLESTPSSDELLNEGEPKNQK